MMFQCHKLYQCFIDLILTKENDKEKAERLMKEKKNYAPSKFYEDISHDETCRDLFRGCMHLLKLSLMFPLSVACVEHLFSKMKLIKTRLRNQLGETTLDSLLRISTESLTGFIDDEYKYFVDELKRLNLHMKIKL